MEKLRIFLATIMLITTLGTVCAVPVQAANSLQGKSALFVGDSIMTGWRDNADGRDYARGRGWGYRIRNRYSMTVDIAAIEGQALSTVRDAYSQPIYKQLENAKGKKYDYIILEGGFNDIMGNEQSAAKETAPLGSMSSSFKLSDFDRKTFASGLEHLLCYATTNFPNARIGFIVTFETPFSNRGNGTNVRATTKKYFDLAKQICDKWNVSYLDFYDGADKNGTKYFDKFYPNERSLIAQYPNGLPRSNWGTLQRIKDDIHPNGAGYEATYQDVAEWMQTLPVYRSPNETTTTTKKPTTTTTTTKKPTTTTTTVIGAGVTTTTQAGKGTTTSVDSANGTTANGSDKPIAPSSGESAPTDGEENINGETTPSDEQTNATASTQPQAAKPSEGSGGGIGPWIYVLVGVACAVAIAVIVVLVILIMKKRAG